ncbi:germin-like protein 3-8 [Ananas comosus]|uniref:Germin-like protein n=1 Tax=Ananas comosus TaxID=4615 RepID=A0A199W712_ANACO|nr:germin-like protein 3-8 [Ananas comosus]OAY84695.1 Germin-like protein 3-8 [Ananas comosus]
MEAKLSDRAISTALLFLLLAVCRSDPNPLRDFCVADLPAADTLTSNGIPCKPPSAVADDDFFFGGLAVEGDTDNALGFNITRATVSEFPALNTLGLSMARIDLGPGGVNVPHTHPRATELVLGLEGRVLVGFVTSSNVYYSKVIGKGELFVVPRGMMHFQFNVGRSKASFVVAFDSQSPGGVGAPLAMFGSKPAIPNQVLAKSLFADEALVATLKAKFGN